MSRRAFTLIEILVSIAIIFLLIGIILVGLRAGRSAARASADRTAIASIKTAITQFKERVGFLPPLVRDGYPAPAPSVPAGSGPLNAARSAVLVYSNSDPAQLAFLCGRDTGGSPWAAGTTDYRYSVNALPIYLVGALGVVPGGPAAAVDGVDGPGFLQPKRDGTFEKAGRRFDAFFDVTKNAKALVAVDASLGRYELRDPYGTAYRYYRWVRGYFNAGQYVDQLVDPVNPATPALNIPEAVVAGPNSANAPIADRVKELTEARDADYAVVGAGPNQLFGDEPIAAIAAKLGVSVPTATDEIDRLRDRAREDNLVELGR